MRNFETDNHHVEIGRGPQAGAVPSIFRWTDERRLTPLKQPFADDCSWPRLGVQSSSTSTRSRGTVGLRFAPEPTFKFECSFRRKLAGSCGLKTGLQILELLALNQPLMRASQQLGHSAGGGAVGLGGAAGAFGFAVGGGQLCSGRRA